MKKILVVDDSPTVRHQVRTALSSSGFPILEASDGVEGIALVKSDDDIALVILDVNMPRMDGLEMLEKVREAKSVGGPVVIMLTSEGQQTFIERAKKAGAKGWLVKPFNPDLLAAAVKKLLAA